MHLRISNIDSNGIATGNAITHDQARALLSRPVSNPSDARFMADGIPRILEPIDAPEGYVAIAPVSYVVEGYCVRKTYTLESIADHEARGAAERAAAAAKAATDAAALAAADAAAHAPDLAALAAALAPFTGISPGMLYPAIEDLMAAQVASADPSAVAPLTAASLRAMSVYSRLASAGISGARLWRALASISTPQTQPTTEETP